MLAKPGSQHLFSLITTRWGLHSPLNPTNTTPTGKSESLLLLLSGDESAPCSIPNTTQQGSWRPWRWGWDEDEVGQGWSGVLDQLPTLPAETTEVTCGFPLALGRSREDIPQKVSCVRTHFSQWEQGLLRAISVCAHWRFWVRAFYSTLWGYARDNEEAQGTPQVPRPLLARLLPTFQTLPGLACCVTPGLSIVRGRIWEKWVPR